jgi:uncharacterized protein YcfJ
MKKLLLTLIFASPLLMAAHPRHQCNDGYTRVVHSQPIYREIAVDRSCRTSHGRNPEGALIGGIVGGVIGNHVGSERNRAATTLGGAIAGAVIGSHIHGGHNCRVTRKVVGYRNVGYWHGHQIIRTSDRPMRRIRVHETRPHKRHGPSHREHRYDDRHRR